MEQEKVIYPCELITMGQLVNKATLCYLNGGNITRDEVYEVIEQECPGFNEYKDRSVYDYCSNCIEDEDMKEAIYVNIWMECIGSGLRSAIMKFIGENVQTKHKKHQ